MGFFSRLFGRGKPARLGPQDRRVWNEDWRRGDLAVCIVSAASWCTPPGETKLPRKGARYRVAAIHEGPSWDGRFLLVTLLFEGFTESFDCAGFRKVRPTIEAADAEFTAELHNRLKAPERAR